MTGPLDRMRNIAVSVVAVEEGDFLAVEVEGGWVRRRAPAGGGYVLTDKDAHTLFLPAGLVPAGSMPAASGKVASRPCAVDGCNRQALASGLCSPCQSFVNGGGLEDTGSQAWLNVKACADRRKKPR